MSTRKQSEYCNVKFENEIGNRVATEIFEYYESLMRGEQKKSLIIMKLGQHQLSRYGLVRVQWKKFCIVKWKAQDVMEIKTRARERLVKEWMPT